MVEISNKITKFRSLEENLEAHLPSVISRLDEIMRDYNPENMGIGALEIIKYLTKMVKTPKNYRDCAKYNQTVLDVVNPLISTMVLDGYRLIWDNDKKGYDLFHFGHGRSGEMN